ncbi:MAG TPA: HIRAN domain-containing protein [Sphingobium sp.]|uniref:HIRAN domain-containing protein n=1 Tax=Sphingobium sp. TaxID=1912891 RepID=UPI002ED110D2
MMAERILSETRTQTSGWFTVSCRTISCQTGAMLRHMSLAIVGADFPNKRGPTRRFEIALCNPGEPVELVPEPRNPVDPNAIAVFSCRGIQIGYITAERAPLIGSWLERHRISGAIFQEKTQWGAIMRIGLDGETPLLPERTAAEVADDDSDFWPDYIPPDDCD